VGNAKTVGQTLMNRIFKERIATNRFIPPTVENCHEDQLDNVYKTSNTITEKIYRSQRSSLNPVLLFVEVVL
jgi:hypothetical protein